MKAPEPTTRAEMERMATAVVDVIGKKSGWAYVPEHVKMMSMGLFYNMFANDWEHTWTDGECAAIFAVYQLTR